MGKCLKRPALERADALGFLCQAVFSHPHATKAERRTRKGHRGSFGLRQACRTVKQGAGLSKLSTGEDRLGPLDHERSRRSCERRSLVQFDSPAEEPCRLLEAISRLQRHRCLSGCLYSSSSVFG
jgi:hypothetical protein